MNNGNSRTKKEFMPIAIKIENLSKQYRLGLISTRTLSHDLNRWYQMNIRGKEDPYLKIGERAEGRSQSAGCRSIRAPKNNLKSPVTDPSLSPGNSAKSHLSHINETELENKSEICNRQSAIASPFSTPCPPEITSGLSATSIWKSNKVKCWVLLVKMAQARARC